MAGRHDLPLERVTVPAVGLRLQDLEKYLKIVFRDNVEVVADKASVSEGVDADAVLMGLQSVGADRYVLHLDRKLDEVRGSNHLMRTSSDEP